MSQLARSRPSRRGGVRPLRPTISDVYLFCYRERVIHLNTKVPDGALDFGATKQQGALRRCRKELVDPAIDKHGGRIVKLMGDGALVEFASVVDAVECAVAIQRSMRETNTDCHEDRSIVFRIGINLGDVIIEGDDICGEGVNIAARLEGIAESGGIAISEDVWRRVRGKVDAKFVDIDEQNLKNIEGPVRVYRADLEGTTIPAAPALTVPPKPSIAVLPLR